MADPASVKVEFDFGGKVETSLTSSVGDIQKRLAELRASLTSLGTDSKGLNVRGLDQLSNQLRGLASGAADVKTPLQDMQNELKGSFSELNRNARGVSSLSRAFNAMESGNPAGVIMGITRALVASGGALSGAMLGFGVLTAVVGICKVALQQWEQDAKDTGAQLEAASKLQQEGASVWHSYAAAVEDATQKQNAFGTSTESMVERIARLQQAIKEAGSGGNLAALERLLHPEAKNEIEAKLDKDHAYSVAQLAAAQPAYDKIEKVRSQYQGQDGWRGSDSFTIPAEVQQFVPGAYKNWNGEITATKDQLDAASRSLKNLVDQQTLAKTANEAQAASVKPLIDSYSQLEKSSKNLDVILSHLEQAGSQGSRSALNEARRELEKQVQDRQSELGKYGVGTDNQSLKTALLDQRQPEEVAKLIKDLLSYQDRYGSNTKAIADLDKKWETDKIARLQEELELRKALGKSNPQDELSTARRELTVAGDDNKLRTPILGKISELKDKAASDSFHGSVDEDKGALDELKSSGVADVEALAKANNKLIADLRTWKNENGPILAQYRDIRKEVEAIEKSTRDEAAHIKGKKLGDNLTKLTQGFAGQDEKALYTSERVAALEDHIRDTKASIAAGTITQAAGEKELVVLEKQKASFAREQVKAREQQLAQIERLKLSDIQTKLQEIQHPHLGGGGLEQLRRGGDVQGLMAQETTLQLNEIDRQYQADLRANKDKTLAAQEASEKKKQLWEKETEAYRTQMDAQVSAEQKRNASPLLSATEGLQGSGVNFSGFSNFGDNFGKSELKQGASALDLFRGAELPDKVRAAFNQQQSFQKPQAPVQSVSTTTNTVNIDGVKFDHSGLEEKTKEYVADVMREQAFQFGNSPSPIMT